MADKISSGLDGVVGYKISSGDNDVGNAFGLHSFKISREVNKIGKALLVFDAGDMPGGVMLESDSSAFDVGKSIKIEAGYGSQLKSIFTGVVVYQTVDIASENNTTLQVECREAPIKATHSSKFTVFESGNAKIKDRKIIEEVLSNYGLTVDIAGADIESRQFSQECKTDWDIALSRASANGLVVIVNGKNVSIKAPDSKQQAEVLEYGTNIIEFNAKLNVTNLYEEVTAESFDSAKQESIKAIAKVDLETQPGLSQNKALNKNYLLRVTENTEKKTLEKIAKAKALQISMAKILGSSKFCGRAEIEIGKLIELKGFGTRFNGKAYISGLDHNLNEDGWTTTVKFGIPLEDMNTTTKATLDMQNVSNSVLQIGVVVKLNDDPDKKHQIQVKILDSSGKEKKLWARLSNFWGSNSYGAFFIPEVNDEVILGFFNNDSSHPVILGSLYNSALPPPNKLTEKNNIQSITTKSKMKLEFDDEKKVITIETPGKNILKISDEGKGISLTDQNKNKIELNNNGITIESAKGITLKAKADIKIEAGTKLEAKAKTDLKLEGMNIEGKAKTMLKMKGSASAEFSASGNTTIKGAIVMIN